MPDCSRSRCGRTVLTLALNTTCNYMCVRRNNATFYVTLVNFRDGAHLEFLMTLTQTFLYCLCNNLDLTPAKCLILHTHFELIRVILPVLKSPHELHNRHPKNT